MIYIINEWHGALNDDTAPLFRTNKKSEFERMKKEILKTRRIYKGTGRTTITKTHTIFSFACNADGFYSLTHLKYALRPIFSQWENDL